MAFKIKTIHAIVGVGPDGDEGIIAWYNPNLNQWMPLVAADEERLHDLTPLAQDICNKTKTSTILARFSVREDVNLLTPQGGESGKAN